MNIKPQLEVEAVDLSLQEARYCTASWRSYLIHLEEGLDHWLEVAHDMKPIYVGREAVSPIVVVG